MANTPDAQDCLDAAKSGGSGILPVDPFTSLRAHFGMLLGVADFETLDAYHRGKTWLHAAWLHGAGAVWGLNVTADLEHGEIRVCPGLAIDALGRELHLDNPACLNVAAWYESHKDDADFPLKPVNGVLKFSAQVFISFKGCLTRQVPALSEPCEGGTSVSAYSRVYETVQIRLVPLTDANPSAPAALPYHRLRLLFGIDAPRPGEAGAESPDKPVLDKRAEIAARPFSDQPAALLAAFRQFSALDEIDLRPATVADQPATRFPALDPAPLLLADLTDITLAPDDQSWKLAIQKVDPTTRRVNVATSTVQELLAGCSFGAVLGGGPRIVRSSLALAPDRRSLSFKTTAPLRSASLTKDAFDVTYFDPTAAANGWKASAVQPPTLVDGQVTVPLNAAIPNGRAFRFIASGRGPMPILGQDLVPLAGADTDPPSDMHHGRDFVHMQG